MRSGNPFIRAAVDAGEVKSPIERAFWEFHEDNPHVYDRLLTLTREMVEVGHSKVGMKMLFEVVRWEHYMQTTDPIFKLNNNFTAHYARLIMRRNPDLSGVFETRELKTATL